MTEDTNLFMDVNSSKAEEGVWETGSDTHEAESPEASLSPGEQEGQNGTVKLVFLGKEMELPLSEAVRWAQKGMNAEYAVNKLKNAPEQELIGFYAAMMGMSRAEFVETLSKNKLKVQTELELARLKETNPELPEHLLLHAARLGAERRLKEFEEARASQEAAEKSLPWQSLAARYPELKGPEDLPEEVLEKIDGGLTPLEAMLGYELEKAQSEIQRLSALLETAEINHKNRSRTTGSAKSFGDGGAKDPFLLGILGA
jgi:hypothetical protein